MGRRLLLLPVAALALLGCGTMHGSARDEAMPIIVVAPGLAERLAFMDAYRANDTREVRLENAAPASSGEDPDAEQTDAAPAPRTWGR